MTMPTLCRIEYMDHKGNWTTGHGSFSFLDPQKYVDKFTLLGRNRIYGVRLTSADGDQFERRLDREMCEHCDEEHFPPFDGSCLI